MPHRAISQIKDTILKPALSHLFLVQFDIPGNIDNPEKGLLNWMLNKTELPIDPRTTEMKDKLLLLCSEANLPGSSLLTHEINNDYTGQTERHAYRRSYDDRIDFTFYVDSDYQILQFFNNWITFICNDDIRKIKRPTYNTRVRFPEDYYTQSLEIVKFEKNNGLLDYAGSSPATPTGRYNPQVEPQKSVLSHRFINAYPININSIPVSYDQPSLLKCTVSFTYSRYYVQLEAPKISQQQPTSPQQQEQQTAAVNANNVFYIPRGQAIGATQRGTVFLVPTQLGGAFSPPLNPP